MGQRQLDRDAREDRGHETLFRSRSSGARWSNTRSEGQKVKQIFYSRADREGRGGRGEGAVLLRILSYRLG